MTDLADIFEPGSLHGKLYALLVHHPRSRLPDIADHLDVSEAQARCALDRLCDVQAAVRLTDADGTPVWDAHAPEALSEAEARRRQQEIATMHAAAARLSQTFRSVRRSPRGAGAVVPVYERLEMLADFEELQVNARHTVKVIERGPFLSDVEREHAAVRTQTVPYR